MIKSHSFTNIECTTEELKKLEGVISKNSKQALQKWVYLKSECK